MVQKNISKVSSENDSVKYFGRSDMEGWYSGGLEEKGREIVNRIYHYKNGNPFTSE
jgi:hypothetical protein